MKNKQVKGFTLIELLIVIGIIAILATVVILTLNPAELLRQARDTTRISDLATVKSALSLYAADVSSPSFGTSTTNGWCFVSISNDVSDAAMSTTTNCGNRLNATITVVASTTEAAKRGVNGSGWIPVNLDLISSGAPISALPVDPVSPNDGGSAATTSDDRFYAYGTDGSGGFVINAVLESKKFEDNAKNDGGPKDYLYEVGTDPGLDL